MEGQGHCSQPGILQAIRLMKTTTKSTRCPGGDSNQIPPEHVINFNVSVKCSLMILVNVALKGFLEYAVEMGSVAVIYIQGVPRGMCHSSGGYSLC
jgi:hypothetical protein